MGNGREFEEGGQGGEERLASALEDKGEDARAVLVDALGSDIFVGSS